MKTLEIRVFELKGILVKVKIDYVEGLISFIDAEDEPKKWCFSNRGSEYMNGWVDILEAMIYATKEAKKLLEIEQNSKKQPGEKVGKKKK